MFDFLDEPITLGGILKFLLFPIWFPLICMTKIIRFIIRLPKNIYRLYTMIKEEKEN